MCGQLLATTPEDHPDRPDTEAALEHVATVAAAVNEAIRRREAVEAAYALQHEFTGSGVDEFTKVRGVGVAAAPRRPARALAHRDAACPHLPAPLRALAHSPARFPHRSYPTHTPQTHPISCSHSPRRRLTPLNGVAGALPGASRGRMPGDMAPARGSHRGPPSEGAPALPAPLQRRAATRGACNARGQARRISVVPPAQCERRAAG